MATPTQTFTHPHTHAHKHRHFKQQFVIDSKENVKYSVNFKLFLIAHILHLELHVYIVSIKEAPT